jgi:hypothetical protein
MKKAVLLILLLFFFFMPLQNWEGLQKSATDDETIEQAIARLIAVHEADATSHLGVGESLQAHKNADVIDHPAQSIVADKLFGGDVVVKSNFESLDPWSITGDVAINGWSGLGLYVEYGAVNTSKVDSFMQTDFYIFKAVSDIYFETQFSHGLSNSHFNAWFGFLNGYASTLDGFGFQIRDGVLYAHVRRNSSTSDTQINGVTLSDSHFYTALFSYADQKVYFKVDGVLVATINVPAGGNWDDDRTPFFGATLTQSNDGTLYFQYLYAWRKVLTP